MTTKTAVPEGFVPVADPVEESVNLPVVAPVAFAQGVAIVYHGSKQVRDNNTMHFVARRETPDKKYILWGAAMLNRKLEKAGAGEVLFLRYLGKEPHPTLEGAEQHTWEVGRSPSAPAVAAGGATTRQRPTPVTEI